MMALVTHQTKGYSPLTVRPQPCSRGFNLRCFVAFQLAGRTEKLPSLKRHFHFRGQPIILPKEKTFKVSSFKSNGQHDEANDTGRESKISKKTVHLSYEPQEREEILAASADVTSTELSYASENKEIIVNEPQAFQKIFKKWLIMLHPEVSSDSVDKIYTRSPVNGETSENQEVFLRQKAENMLKATLLSFMGLDAAIKIPLLIFVPWYFMTRMVYGVEVTEELTPLWVLGPLIFAVYIKLVQGLSSLYIFCFKRSIKFLKNAPIYHMLVCNYVAEGKLQAFLYAHFYQPILNVKNMDYEALMREKLKELKEWTSEKYLDYVESIWPYYCRTVRFLKKANLL